MRIWYQKNIISIILFPLSLIYRLIIFIRHFCYKIKLFASHKINIPVIIVGNISVGGTGKTPLLIALVKTLQKQGFYPCVISRGYGGKSKTWPVLVDKNSDPGLVGDEAVLIAKSTGVPVAVGPNRVASIAALLTRQGDARVSKRVIISDDGLQHYALQRDIEIAVIDSTRRFGNGFCLPAGPLREPISRLKTVDFIVMNARRDKSTSLQSYSMQFILDDIVKIKDDNKKLCSADLKNKKIIAVAGIGNPERFFQSLRSHDITFATKIFPDHHAFQKNDFDEINADIILITEKDAVKCMTFADERFYEVRGHAEVDERFFQAVIEKL